VVESVIKAFQAGSFDSKDGPYSFFQNSLLLHKPINTVPMTTQEEKKSAFQYGDFGYKHFHPWFLADLNPSSIDEYFQLVMQVLPHVDPILNRQEYWFFRADINILMMWYRVCHIHVLLICLLVIDDMGFQQLPIRKNYISLPSYGILSSLQEVT
jgi:hypothetical protein